MSQSTIIKKEGGDWRHSKELGGGKKKAGLSSSAVRDPVKSSLCNKGLGESGEEGNELRKAQILVRH